MNTTFKIKILTRKSDTGTVLSIWDSAAIWKIQVPLKKTLMLFFLP